MNSLFDTEFLKAFASEVKNQLLPELRTAVSNSSVDEDYMIDMEKAAVILDVKPSWLQNNATKLEIPKYKVGGQVRFIKKELMSWAKKQKTL